VRVVKFDERGMDVPLGCLHCERAPCASACPVGAISTDADTGAVLIDHDVCVGCRLCIGVCPFGAIGYNEETGVVYKCDLCAGDPECVKWCFTGAIRYVEGADDVAAAKRRRGAERVAASLEDTRKLSMKP